MSRFTKSNLVWAIEDINAELKDSGSNYFYRYGSRNGYHAVDLCANVDGAAKTLRCVDCNEPPRVLAEKVEDDYTYYMGVVVK